MLRRAQAALMHPFIRIFDLLMASPGFVGDQEICPHPSKISDAHSIVLASRSTSGLSVSHRLPASRPLSRKAQLVNPVPSGFKRHQTTCVHFVSVEEERLPDVH